MQFLDEYRMDFLKHMQIIKNLDAFSESDLKDNAQFSLNFVISIILKWQEQGVLTTINSKNRKSKKDE